MQPQATSMRARIVEALVLRMRLALQAFGDAGCTTAVLGAVGCGVFQIQPGDCVRAWQQALALDGAPFERIVFALGPMPSAEMQQAFSGLEKAFGAGLSSRETRARGKSFSDGTCPSCRACPTAGTRTTLATRCTRRRCIA